MAIYHLSASIIKRSAGRSVTAAAAYRAAAKIEDLKTGIIYDYSRKQGVDYSEIISPVSANSNLSNEWLTNRAELWNKIEQIEKRKDAQLAREVTIALPTELSKLEQIALVREYVNTNYVAAGMIADINLHHLDGDNPHAHILLTMRNLQTSPAGVVEFGLKNTDWNSKELLLAQRKSWEEVTNKYLAARGLDTRIDCRSLEEQGSPFIPQIHVGVHAMAMKRKGIATERGDEFDQIEAANNDIRARLERIYEEESTPEPEFQQPYYIDETIEERNKKIGELAFEMTKNPNSFARFQGFKLKQYSENYIEIATDSRAKILEIKREGENWNITIRYPNKYTKKSYSQNYINELVQNFEDCIREPHNLARNQESRVEIENNERIFIKQELLRDDQIGKSIQHLLNLFGVKGRTFYPLRFEINSKSDKIKVFDRWQGGRNHQTIYEFYLVDNKWQKSLGNKRGIIPIDNLDIRVEELIDQAHKVTNLKSLSYIELSDIQKDQIMRHYAKNGDLQNSYPVRDDKPHYSIEGSRKMLEDGWDNETVKSVFNTPDKNLEVLEVNHTQKQIPLMVPSGNVIAAIDLIRQTFAERVEEKLEEPKTSEPTPAIEKAKTIVVEENPIVEDEQPIKVAEIHPPQKPERTQRRPDRGGR